MNRLLPFLAWRQRSLSPLKALEMGFYDSTSAPGAEGPAATDAGTPESSFAGWHDSSHDLLNGLAVTEHASFDDPGPDHRPQ